MPARVNEKIVHEVLSRLSSDLPKSQLWECVIRGQTLLIRPWQMGVNKDSIPLGGFSSALLSTEKPNFAITVTEESGRQLRYRVRGQDQSEESLTIGNPSALKISTDCMTYHVEYQGVPDWASCFAWDRYGIYADITIKGIPVRLRWIPPGAIPLKHGIQRDSGGDSEESMVTITHGFWLSEHALTEREHGLIVQENVDDAIQGQVDSHFKTWEQEQCSTFFQTLNGLPLNLGHTHWFRPPTQAEWAYCCIASNKGLFALNCPLDTVWQCGASKDMIYNNHPSLKKHVESKPSIRIALSNKINDTKGMIPWVTRFGWDRYGLFAQFEIDGVAFDLRWIPPGTFMMGSPEDEPGRWSAEGPQHQVTIEQGFWMGTTPVTQVQYNTVTGKRPSHFEHAGDHAPVEQVTWDECLKFCQKLGSKVEGVDADLEFGLPTEAQWEYACRAGTTTALYTGPLTIKGECDGPELDAVAWYGGNSGIEYEGGVNSSNWPNKQYDHKKAGTHPVAQKVPNPWGLYDMLGNVWEWCQDTWHDKYEGAPDDGSAWTQAGEFRVIRGGSFFSRAWDCRCAFRDFWPPDDRDHDRGFRLVLAHRSKEKR